MQEPLASRARTRSHAIFAVMHFALLTWLISTASASAQSQKMVNWCIGKNNATPEQIAQGCTAIIAAHKTKGAVLGSAYLNRGLAYKMMGDYDRALKEYNIAISLAPRFPLCYINRSAVYSETGRYDLALADASKAIALNPKAVLGYYNRASVLVKQGKDREALPDFDKAIALDPKYGPAYNNRALAKIHLKDYDAAIADATVAIKLVPRSGSKADHALPLGTRSDAYRGKKDYANAIKDLSAAIDLNPKPVYFGIRSGLYELNGEPEKCLPDLARLIELTPKSFVGWQSRCWVNGVLGKLDDAMADCSKALELAPGSSRVVSTRGDIYLKMGNYDKAIADYDAALKIEGYTGGSQVGENAAMILYPRGLAKTKKGDQLGGAVDMTIAKRASPDVADNYKRLLGQ